MYITDQKSNPKPLEDTPQVIQISRENAPFFASVIGNKAAETLSKLEQSILEDPGKRGIAPWHQGDSLIQIQTTTATNEFQFSFSGINPF